MANRIVGVDSLSPVSEELVAAVAKALGTTPAFWGRYFTSKTTTGTGEFRHVAEDGVLSNHGIRVLPIARQTNRVGGTGTDGQSDGQDNAEDLLATFGAAHLASMGGGVRIFLDVEGSGSSRLSRAYYDGWAQGLAQASGGIGILPCVYGIRPMRPPGARSPTPWPGALPAEEYGSRIRTRPSSSRWHGTWAC
jgi:hypothetical protein